MKKMLIMAILIAPLTAMAIEEYDIKFTKKIASKREGDTRRLAFVSTRSTSEDIYYLIEIRRKTTTSPARVNVEYGAMVEGTGGRLYMKGYGSKDIYIDFGNTIELESDTFNLSGREFDRHMRSGSVEEDVEGFGLRIKTLDGEVLTEKYSPKSIEKELCDELNKRAKLISEGKGLEQRNDEEIQEKPRRRLPPRKRKRLPLLPFKR